MSAPSNRVKPKAKWQPCHRCGAKDFTLSVNGSAVRECRDARACTRRCGK